MSNPQAASLASTTAIEPVSAESDASLIRACIQKGDQKAFRQLMERYLPLVFSHVYRMTQNYELSEEMAQEAFVKAYSHLSSFDPERPFRPWILRIASNAAISQLRKPANTNVVSMNALEESSGFDPESTRVGDDPADAIETQSEQHAIFAAVQRLDEKYREPLLLRYQSDMSYEEVADTLKLPLNTVRTRLKRGLEKLREPLSDFRTQAALSAHSSPTDFTPELNPSKGGL